jgi:glycosyltransferase involved in cell wall biosynthesis
MVDFANQERKDTRKMRIAVWHDLPSGGGKRALYQHVRGLVDRGHYVESWCLDTADQTYLPLSQLATEHVCALDLNGNQATTDAERETGLSEAFDDACRRCAAEIEAGGFDLLFANTAQRFHVPYVLKYVQIPKVLYLQEPSRPMYEAWPILPWISADHEWLEIIRARAKQEWLSARFCDTILVNSYFSRESVARALGVGAKVCYLGIDTSLFQNLNLERQQFVLGVGSFSYNKRIELAVEALALIPEPRPPLVWISNSRDQNYQHEVEALAGSLGVDLRIRLAVSDADLVSILNQAALFIYTSRLEPFGFAPLEANACGLPVVAVAEGGVRETIKDGFNGFLVEPDAAALADAMKGLLRKPDLARGMGENGITYVRQNWDLSQSLDRLEGLLILAASNKSVPDKTKEIGLSRIASATMEQFQRAIPRNGNKPGNVSEKKLDASVRQCEVTTQPTPQQQLDAILSTRAWRWVSRYGRFKYRFLMPAYNGCRRLFGRRD